jgi:hypothetical protein
MDRSLAAALAAEDRGMHADDRATCHTHRCWAEDCADHPMHTHLATYAFAPSLFSR